MHTQEHFPTGSRSTDGDVSCDPMDEDAGMRILAPAEPRSGPFPVPDCSRSVPASSLPIDRVKPGDGVTSIDYVKPDSNERGIDVRPCSSEVSVPCPTR